MRGGAWKLCFPHLFFSIILELLSELYFFEECGFKKMKIKKGFVLRDIAGQAMVIATGEASKNFNGMIKLNQTGKQVWQGVSDGLTAEEIARGLSSEYSISEEKALADVNGMIERMEKAGFLCE